MIAAVRDRLAPQCVATALAMAESREWPATVDQWLDWLTLDVSHALPEALDLLRDLKVPQARRGS
jgi:hypothetical protein